MNRMKIFVWILLLGFPYSVCSQDACKRIYFQAKQAYEKGNYDLALSKLLDNEICDVENKLRSQRQRLQQRIFQSIEQQRIDALIAKQNSDSLLNISNRKLAANKLLTKALELREDNPTYAFRIAEEAWRLDPENKANSEFLSQILSEKKLFSVCIGCKRHRGPIFSGLFSPNGKIHSDRKWR